MGEDNKYNILIECGATFVLPFIWYDSDGVPYDLTGSTVTAQLREYSGAQDYYEFICTHNGAGGRIVLTLPKEETAKISYSYGCYDVFVDLPSGDRQSPLYGDAKIRDHVTKPSNGTVLYMVGVSSFSELPVKGEYNRIYFTYDTMEYYRWNGQNYILTGMSNIQSVQKISIDGLVDTYRMTFENGVYFDYQITNGRGIVDVAKVRSYGDYASGLVDVYNITFNDGTVKEYEIRNGRVEFAVFDVDIESGELIMTTPEYFQGPDFELDEESGELYLVVGEE